MRFSPVLPDRLIVLIAMAVSAPMLSGNSGCGSSIDLAGLDDGQVTYNRTGDVSGLVRDAVTLLPVAEATVRAGGATEITDPSGSFHLANLKVGSHALTILATGYQPFAQTIEITTGANAVGPFDMVLSCSDQPCHTIDQSYCEDGVIHSCMAGDDGCLTWNDGVSCPEATCANGASCTGCTPDCFIASATSCDGGEISTCAVGADGCMHWQPSVACGSGFCADANQCGQCSNICAVGTSICVGGVVRSCIEDGWGCPTLGQGQACEFGWCANENTCGNYVVGGEPEIEIQYEGVVVPSLASSSCEDGTCTVLPEKGLDFGAVSPGGDAFVTIIARNTAECFDPNGACDVCALTVESFGLVDTNGVFSFVGSVATPFVIPQADIGCGETGEVRLLLGFSAPLTTGNYAAELTIGSNDPEAASISIPIKASVAAAPVAVASFRVRDLANPTAPWTDPNNIQPLERVYLDGSQSYDPTGAPIVAYRWQMVEWPAGLDPVDFAANGATTAYFSVWVPLAGHYVAKLEVAKVGPDSQEVWSGAGANSTVSFMVIPGSRLHVQLTWDDDENDQDLHLVKVASDNTAAVCHEPTDCYYSNKTPLWFDSYPIADGPNPRLDIDDTHGLGPENINIDDPAPGTYRLFVHYYANITGGEPTNCRVRIYVNGSLAFSEQRLLTANDIWGVADVIWGATPLVQAYPSDVNGEIGTVVTFYSHSLCTAEGWVFPQ